MTTDLDPPRVPPLTPPQHDRLRRQVMDRTRPVSRPMRTWGPLVAVGAVAAIVAGSVVVAQQSHDEPSPATESTPTPSKTPVPRKGSVKIPASPIHPPAITLLPFPVAVDLGPVPQAEADAAAAKSCRVPHANQPVQVLWARRVRGISPYTKLITMVVKGSQGIVLCQPEVGVVPVSDSQWARQPSARHGVAEIGSGKWKSGPTMMFFQQWTIYRARPDIARIESRYVWKTGAGPWIHGVVADGFAYTDVRGIPVPSPTGLTRQIRAYDAQGRPVPV